MAGLFVGGHVTGSFGLSDFSKVEYPSIFWHEDSTLGILELSENAIDSTARDTGNTDGSETIDTTLRAGLVLAQVRSTGLLKQWDPTATDGTAVPVGFLANTTNIAPGGTVRSSQRAHGLVTHGRVLADKIIIPGETDRGIVGKDYEFALVRALRHNFVFGRNDPYNYFGGDISPEAASRTLDSNDIGRVFTNEGATGNITLTLPTPKLGMEIEAFLTDSSGTLTVAGSLWDGSAQTTDTVGAAGNKYTVMLIDGAPLWVIR